MKDCEKYTIRENFLMSLLIKFTREYKKLLDFIHSNNIKPFKIIEIINPSNIPGETQFVIQVTNKN